MVRKVRRIYALLKQILPKKNNVVLCKDYNTARYELSDSEWRLSHLFSQCPLLCGETIYGRLHRLRKNSTIDHISQILQPELDTHDYIRWDVG